MSYLDNLENNLKALENREERDPEKVRRDHQRRDAERDQARLRAPYVDALKTSAFTGEFLTQCRAIGHGQRVLVKFTWLGENLRLDAQSKRLELTPTAEGIVGVYSQDGAEVRRRTIDLEKDDPAAVAQEWLSN